ncbi:GUC2E-like protein, partial [Mya arenaria]
CCRGDPLTNKGKRIQLFKILCLTVIPILGVWGFTMHSLTVSVDTKGDIDTAKTSMAVVVMLGQLIHHIQRERDMSVLYLSDLGPGTKTFLLADNPREEFRSKANLMSFITQHRASLNPNNVDIFEEINFYSSITKEFLEWLVENIKGSGFGSIWKTLVAYQKITRCKEDIGVERAYGAMFYATGHFEKWTDYEFYNEKIHDFKYNYKTAVFYSDAVVPLHREEVEDIQSTGLNITEIIFDYRDEIQNHVQNESYKSIEKAKWFFDNITIYLDSLLQIQLKVAARISSEVEVVLSEVIIKTAVYALMVVVVIAMCPVIMFAANGLSTDIQLYTVTLVEKTKELNVEKYKTETLLYQMVPKSVADNLKSTGSIESEFFKSVTIFFSDIAGFHRITLTVAPMELVRILNNLYTAMDNVIDNFDVYKVETINDSYMVASGLPNKNGDRHAPEIANLAMDILNMMKNKTFPCSKQVNVRLRIGINTGSCMAGIVGNIMLRYCLFGDSINTASRMKTHGSPNRIHISESTQLVLSKVGGFRMKFRGTLNIKGKGLMKTYWIYNRWEDADEIIEAEKEELNIPGELMNYSDVRLCGANTATYIDAGDTGAVSDRRPIWREEDVYVAGSGGDY